jgi:hypothetical protein
MPTNYLGDFVGNLAGIGVFEYLLPFLLVFAILFGILEKIKIFGDGKKNLNMVISFIVALIIVVNTAVVELMNLYLSKMALFIVVILVLIMAFGVFSKGQPSGWGIGLFVIASIVAVIWALGPTWGWSWPEWAGVSDQAKFFIGIIIAFVVVVGLIGWGGSGQKNPVKGFGKGLEELGKSLGGGGS